MRDFSDLLNTIKKIAVEAVSATKPTSVVYGEVISTSPLRIKVEQKMTLTSPQLVLTRNVTDFEIEMTVEHNTESSLEGLDLTHSHEYSGSTDNGGTEPHNHSYSGTTNSSGSTNLTHVHAYTGRKTFTVHNSLVVGDEVLMIQMQGGQKYIVIDRVMT